MAAVILLYNKCLPLFYTPNSEPESVFVNIYGAQESIPMDGLIPGRTRLPICSLAGRYDKEMFRVVVQARHAGN